MENTTSPEVKPAVKHIRKTDHNVKDARFRSRVRFANKLRPVFCGAEPSTTDVSRADAIQIIKSDRVRVIYGLAAWSADFCPTCVAALGEIAQ